jgi:hypothetical protein
VSTDVEIKVECNRDRFNEAFNLDGVRIDSMNENLGVELRILA